MNLKNKVPYWQIGLLIITISIGCKISNSNQADEKGFVNIFDGKTLNNWEGDPTYWRVENGNLVGEITPQTLLKTNSFIMWKGGEPADFELKGDVNITEKGNSGINYRSEKLTDVPYALKGYLLSCDFNIFGLGLLPSEKKSVSTTEITIKKLNKISLGNHNPGTPGFFIGQKMKRQTIDSNFYMPGEP